MAAQLPFAVLRERVCVSSSHPLTNIIPLSIILIIMIEVRNLTFFYKNPENLALDNINLKIEKGEFIAILGDNGSGKSTLAKHLNALLKPVEGDVLINGMNTKESKFLQDVRKSVGMVFQNPFNQIIGETVEEDIAFGCENLGLSEKETKKRIEEVIAYFELQNYLDISPNFLSSGKLQLLSIADCLVMQPECIVFDEPTSMLDYAEKKKVREVVKKLNKEKNITIIYITQSPEEAIMAERIILLSEGKIILDERKEDFLKDVEKLKKFNLKIPDVLFLSSELKKEGININIDYSQENFLCQLKSLI